MKKGLFVLAVLVMAFGNAGFAQHKANLKSDATQNVLKHYGVRDETSEVPFTAVWHTADGEDFRTTYTYDEYEYYLVEELVEMKQDGAWLNYSIITYEYDFSGNVFEALAMSADGNGGWEPEDLAVFSYENGELSEIIFQYWDGNEWVNDVKEVYTYNDNVTTVLYWDWNGNNWTSDELWTYTRTGNTIELVMQYMQGGAWQNDEKIIYMLDFDEHVTEIVYSDWTGTEFEIATRKVYNYEEGVYVSVIEEDWLNGSWEPHYKCDYVYEDGNATHGESHMISGGNLVADYELEMAYGYNAATKTFYGSEVDMTYVDLTGVDENSQANFKVYPVPAENEIQIEADGFQKAEIYSVTGQKLMESLRDRMNVSTLSSGLYIMKVYDHEGGCATQRFMVK